MHPDWLILATSSQRGRAGARHCPPVGVQRGQEVNDWLVVDDGDDDDASARAAGKRQLPEPKWGPDPPLLALPATQELCVLLFDGPAAVHMSKKEQYEKIAHHWHQLPLMITNGPPPLPPGRTKGGSDIHPSHPGSPPEGQASDRYDVSKTRSDLSLSLYSVPLGPPVVCRSRRSLILSLPAAAATAAGSFLCALCARLLSRASWSCSDRSVTRCLDSLPGSCRPLEKRRPPPPPPIKSH